MRIGFVIIGRNEGERLIRCLRSLLGQVPEGCPVVYVDSGSTDGSLKAASSLGVTAIPLDDSLPFSMARGRNTGLDYLAENFAEIEYAQMIDGDCVLIEGWLEKAVAMIESDRQLAIVCGRRRERFPEASPYNQIADMEWNTPVGEALACGGDALVRIAAVRSVGKYNPALICGEEPEMCIRLRQQGWKIYRLDADMTLHDAAMLQFGQWWQRSVRGGWAIAEGKAMYGSAPEKYMVRQAKSGWLWGALVPLLSLGLAWPTSGLSLLMVLAYPLLAWRIYSYRRSYGDLPAQARLYGFFCMISKFPQLLGQLKYSLTRWQGKQATLIEYKTSTG